MSEYSYVEHNNICIPIKIIPNVTIINHNKFYMVQVIKYDDDNKNIMHSYKKPVKQNNTEDVLKYLKKCVIEVMDDLEIWYRYDTKKHMNDCKSDDELYDTKKEEILKKQMKACKSDDELYNFVSNEMGGQYVDRLIGWDVYVYDYEDFQI